jgi:hypothetical protein
MNKLLQYDKEKWNQQKVNPKLLSSEEVSSKKLASNLL